MSAIITAVASAASAFIGAWLAARFGLDRFYKEKVWERRAIAYTEIFAGLHDQERWFEENLTAKIFEREISKKEQAAMLSKIKEATELLNRRASSEAWLISDAFRERLESSTVKPDADWNWQDYLEHMLALHLIMTKDLLEIARADLSVK